MTPNKELVHQNSLSWRLLMRWKLYLGPAYGDMTHLQSCSWLFKLSWIHCSLNIEVFVAQPPLLLTP